jgi:hypothetical protein
MLQLGATAVLAETPHATPMLGVSSAWSGGELMRAHPSQNGKLQLASIERTSGQPASTFRIQPDVQQGNQKVRKEKRNSVESKLLNEKSLESLLDSWQINLKHLLNDAPSRLKAFLNWASHKLGFSRGGTVPNMNMKMAPSPAVIRVHLQPVSNNHSAWLTSDGRLKTVTAH